MAAYNRAIEISPNKPLHHKGLINALEEEGELEEVFRYYDLERKDSNSLKLNGTDPICCVAVRNESLR